jgi:mono/diheme cytochrome c family protein
MAKNWRLWALLLLVVVIGGDFLLFRSGLFEREQPVVINGIAAPPVPTLDATRVVEGQLLYAQHCASCHGVNLEGERDWQTPLADGSFPAPPHDSSGHTWHHPDELLIDITLNGGNPRFNSKMPAFNEQLSREQVVAILEFFKSEWGREERDYQWWVTAVGDQQ